MNVQPSMRHVFFFRNMVGLALISAKVLKLHIDYRCLPKRVQTISRTFTKGFELGNWFTDPGIRGQHDQ